MSEKIKIPKFYEFTRPLMIVGTYICAIVIIFQMILICLDVFMRYVFNSPIIGVTEMVAMLMAWVAYSSLGYALLDGKHMQLAAIYEKLTGRIKSIDSFIIFLLGFLLYIVMIKASYNIFVASWAIKEKAVSPVTVYVFIGKFGVLIGWILLAIQSLLMTLYYAYGSIYPDRVESFEVMSEIPTEDDIKIFVGKDIDEEKLEGRDDNDY